MLDKIIEIFFVNFLFIMFILSLICIFFKLRKIKKGTKTKDKLDIVIRWFMLLCFGIEGVYAFVFHVFFPNTSSFIGWMNSPFQFEVGMANLAVCIPAIYAFFRKHDYNFWLPTIITNSIFLLGAAYGHIMQIIKNNNWAPDNAGTMLWTEIFIAILIPCLLCKYKNKKA